MLEQLIIRHASGWPPCNPATPNPNPRSACRAVWYCSTECAKANWRQGGHREVCSALRAARREERAQGRLKEQQQGEQGEEAG